MADEPGEAITNLIQELRPGVQWLRLVLVTAQPLVTQLFKTSSRRLEARLREWRKYAIADLHKPDGLSVTLQP
jgi:hypothetical protein